MINVFMKLAFLICGWVFIIDSTHSILEALICFIIAGLFSIASSIDMLSYKEGQKTKAVLEGLIHGSGLLDKYEEA